jgi:hypothetical protein
MAKIKLNGELPKGFKLVDGKIVEDKLMRHGGSTYTTGDQADYGLVTTSMVKQLLIIHVMKVLEVV